MMSQNGFSAERPGAADADDMPPHPFDEPALFDGLIWRRVLAYFVDFLLICVLSAAAWLVVGMLAALTFGLLAPAGMVALALIPLAYHTYFLGSRGATPGMRLFDLEMWTLSGEPLDYVQAALTTVLFYISISLTASLILVFVLFNDRRRTLHDVLAGTLALRREALTASAP